jgi:predicted nucleic-acid-binding protein
MKVIVDTNVLVHFLVKSEKGAEQHNIAAHFIDDADEIIIPTQVVCELVWVLVNGYKLSIGAVYLALSDFLQRDKIVTHEDEIEAGMFFLKNGGDFADGVNAHLGYRMTYGRAVFISFDKKAVRLLTKRGIPAIIPQLY